MAYKSRHTGSAIDDAVDNLLNLRLTVSGQFVEDFKEYVKVEKDTEGNPKQFRFVDKDTDLITIKDGQLIANNFNVGNQMKMGKFLWTILSNGNLSLQLGGDK